VARKEQYVVGLDVGTSKIAAIVGEMLDDGSLDVVGIGVAESHGIRRGVVTNLEAAVESIKKAIEEAELTAGVEIDMVHLAVAGPHIKGFNSRGVIAVAGKSREITRDDVRRAALQEAVGEPSRRGAGVERLRDVVVGPEHEAGCPVECIRLSSRHENHREIAVERLVQLAHDFEAAGAWQLDLDDRERRSVGAEPLQQLVSVWRGACVVPQPNGHLNRRQA